MSLLKIFLGSIPPNVTDEQVQAEARQFGDFESHYYKPDQNNKGWAFVTYRTAEEAQNAINALHQKFIFPGTTTAIEARLANNKNNRKRERPLPAGWAMYTDPSGKVYYHHAETQRTQWEFPEDEANQGHSRSHGGQSHHHGDGQHKSSQFGPVNANLFVFHIPNDWTDQELHNQFAPFGEILSARIQKDPTGRNKGFGFVSYTTAESATAAISKMDGHAVSGKWLKVQHKKGEGNGHHHHHGHGNAHGGHSHHHGGRNNHHGGHHNNNGGNNAHQQHNAHGAQHSGQPGPSFGYYGAPNMNFTPHTGRMPQQQQAHQAAAGIPGGIPPSGAGHFPPNFLYSGAGQQLYYPYPAAGTFPAGAPGAQYPFLNGVPLHGAAAVPNPPTGAAAPVAAAENKDEKK